ncbi:Histidine protein methyltransferase 1-like protein [Trichoplax sp. H2]|nr:Histidine protein methyltransferase 1-like protein [Trichoplax sp. H2]|eukprot:RDD38586.1 Histidine protein methyltransferase 1-like protein [Trichoplax sp. H2]
MTSFRFNFNISSEDQQEVEKSDRDNEPSPGQHCKEAIEIVCDRIPDIDKQQVESIVLGNDDQQMQYINAKYVEKFLTDNKECATSGLITAIENNSDLVPSVYEGGLKVWECSFDLVEYFQEQSIQFRGKNVIELGCGAGLPGIYALNKAAKRVDFQDYNEEVIRYVTVPNVFLNCSSKSPKQQIKKKCHFYAGDWSNMGNVLQDGGNNRYDFVLTSETIYSEESQDKLYKLIKGLLKENGVAYIAAKTIYFGVGGGTRAFEALVSNDNYFQCEVCKRITLGVNREILRLHRSP